MKLNGKFSTGAVAIFATALACVCFLNGCKTDTADAAQTSQINAPQGLTLLSVPKAKAAPKVDRLFEITKGDKITALSAPPGFVESNAMHTAFVRMIENDQPEAVKTNWFWDAVIKARQAKSRTNAAPVTFKNRSKESLFVYCQLTNEIAKYRKEHKQ